MIDKTIISSAKAFLCWEVFDSLSIQLVSVTGPVGYYYPPDNPVHSIVLFCQERSGDFSEALFLLFHEAGHVKQWQRLRETCKESCFQQKMNLDRGREKAEFERQAWEDGAELFLYFVKKEGLDTGLIERFRNYSISCIESYSSEP